MQVRYLRVLSNSLLASALLSAYLVITALFLNPRFPLSQAAPLALACLLAYGANAVLVFYALVVLRQIADMLHLDYDALPTQRYLGAIHPSYRWA